MSNDYDDDLYLDLNQLGARGWTKSLIEKYLGKPDRWKQVAHWQNFTGKATYFLSRVILTESQAPFQSDFQASIRRRKLSPDQLDTILAFRSRFDDDHSSRLTRPTPEETKRDSVISKAASIFEEVRARGYHTPHK